MTAAMEVPQGCVIVGGKAWPCASPTKLWKDTGLSFRAGQGARHRGTPPDLVVWHYTAGEGDAQQVHRTLMERSLGIEFIIDRDGMIYQCCDPFYVDTFDAGHVNARSVGVEIVSCGTPSIGPKGSDRGSYVATVHGRETTFARFYPAQLKAASSLADTLSAALGIPRRVPAAMGVMADAALDAFKGHVGHLHVKASKLDPGTELFKAFRGRGYDAV